MQLCWATQTVVPTLGTCYLLLTRSASMHRRLSGPSLAGPAANQADFQGLDNSQWGGSGSDRMPRAISPKVSAPLLNSKSQGQGLSSERVTKRATGYRNKPRTQLPCLSCPNSCDKQSLCGGGAAGAWAPWALGTLFTA